MNWLLIIIVLILLISIIQGAKRGFIKVIFSLLGLIAVLGFSIIATPHVNSFLMENTTVYETIEEICQEKIQERVQGELQEEGSSFDGLLNEIGIALPDGILKGMEQSIGGTISNTLEVTGVYGQAAAAVAKAVVNGLAFIVSLFIGAIIVAIIKKLLDLLTDLPGLKTVNRVLGVVAGAVQGLVIVWVMLYLIGICSGFGIIGNLASMIRESEVLMWLYENNPLASILSHSSVLFL